MVSYKNKSRVAVLLTLHYVLTSHAVMGLAVPMFHEKIAMQRTAPSKTEGIEIELPDFDELFRRIQEVSPLACQAIQGGGSGVDGGFKKVDDFRSSPNMEKWKVVEGKKKKIIHQIDKIDNFQNLGCPILRFRSSLKGPCSGMKFAEFIMNFKERVKWDTQISNVEQIYSIYDTEAANIAMGVGKYGDCSLLGVGYCQTKANIITDGREQLTLCGIQNFADGSSLIWGTEMEEWHNHLLPPCPRRTRAKSHLFSTALIPTGPDTFDVEYVLQLEIGGKIPGFLGSPVVIETVRSLFRHASQTFKDKDIMAPYNKRGEDVAEDIISERYGILMSP